MKSQQVDLAVGGATPKAGHMQHSGWGSPYSSASVSHVLCSFFPNISTSGSGWVHAHLSSLSGKILSPSGAKPCGCPRGRGEEWRELAVERAGGFSMQEDREDGRPGGCWAFLSPSSPPAPNPGRYNGCCPLHVQPGQRSSFIVSNSPFCLTLVYKSWISTQFQLLPFNTLTTHLSAQLIYS